MPDAATSAADKPKDRWGLNFSRPAEDTLLVALSGSWTSGAGLPSTDEVEKQIRSASGVRVRGGGALAAGGTTFTRWTT